MVNIISSAITNSPPPMAVANLMHRRNKLHRLDHKTQENLMHLFRESPDPNGKKRKCSATMPARNYAIITEHAGLAAKGVSPEAIAEISGVGPAGDSVQPSANGHGNGNGEAATKGVTHVHQNLTLAKQELGGTAEDEVSAMAPAQGTTRPFALDVAFRVEIDPKDSEGKTKAYGFAIPALEE